MTVAMPTALGFKLHTGWVALVAVTGDPHSLGVLLRRHAELLPADSSIPRFVYHEAAELDGTSAAKLVHRAERASHQLARSMITQLIAELKAQNATPAVCGVITSSATVKAGTSLTDILQSHPLIHASEGLLFQHAIVDACENAGLVVTKVRERDVWAAAAKARGCDVGTMRKNIEALRKTVGVPWTADEKLATAAAIVAAGQIAPQLT